MRSKNTNLSWTSAACMSLQNKVLDVLTNWQQITAVNGHGRSSDQNRAVVSKTDATQN